MENVSVLGPKCAITKEHGMYMANHAKSTSEDKEQQHEFWELGIKHTCQVHKNQIKSAGFDGISCCFMAFQLVVSSRSPQLPTPNSVPSG